MSTDAAKKFALKALQLFPPYRWDDEQENDWILDVMRQTAHFSDDVTERAQTDMVRSRKRKDGTPAVSEMIRYCAEAKRWSEAEANKGKLPILDAPDGDGREHVVWNVLMKTDIAKQAAREGWVGMLVPYCYEHGRLPADKADIERMKRGAASVDSWDGSNSIIANVKIKILEKRNDLADRVLNGVVK